MPDALSLMETVQSHSEKLIELEFTATDDELFRQFNLFVSHLAAHRSASSFRCDDASKPEAVQVAITAHRLGLYVPPRLTLLQRQRMESGNA